MMVKVKVEVRLEWGVRWLAGYLRMLEESRCRGRLIERWGGERENQGR